MIAAMTWHEAVDLLFWPAAAGLYAVVAAGAFLARSLETRSETRLNAHLRRRGRPALEASEQEALDDCAVFLGAVDQIGRLVIMGLLAWRAVAEGLTPGETAGLLAGFIAAVVVGLEIAPRAVGRTIPERVVAGSLGPLRRLFAVAVPAVRAHRAALRFLVRAGGGDPDKRSEEAVEEEILAAAADGEREGLIERGGKDMIESIISFYDAEAASVMTPRIAMVSMAADLTLPDGVRIATTCGHSRIPVFKGTEDNIVGILYVKDFLRHFGAPGWETRTIGDIVRKAYFVPENKKISALFQEFKTQRFHIAIVLDEYGGTAGLITIEDILEEIVGEIADEFEIQRAGTRLRRIDERTFEVDAAMRADDLEDALDIVLPGEDSYETVAGFLYSLWGRIPRVGEAMAQGRLRFEVVEADERRVKTVRVHLGAER
ncbi:MAG: Magnesium and cobalt efflux protein CorC [Planctomycetes bacterium ADurb.Bin069]|jgi:CBS domain containing-hemolysin-like protein|nr:MAG: Magnesium and cobalt efflux protein CorC [Planctomycetes bacterium ADurb.Bin069]